jgi:hypothetical protein
MYTSPPPFSFRVRPAYPEARSEKRLEEPPDNQESCREDPRGDPHNSGDTAQDDERSRPPLTTTHGLADGLSTSRGLVAAVINASHG